MNSILKYLSLFIVLNYTQQVSAQTLELRSSTSNANITIKGQQATVSTDSKEQTFNLNEIKGATAAEFINLLAIDTNEVNDLLKEFSGSCAQRIIKAATQHNGTLSIVPSTTESNSLINSDDEIGGISTNEVTARDHKDAADTSDWITTIGLLLGGLILGLLLGYFIKKKQSTTETPNQENSSNKTEEQKRLQSTIQQLNQNLKKSNSDLNKKNKFYKSYFDNALKSLIVPFNDAAAKGDKEEMVALALKMSAQYASLARYELKLKQSYDPINVSNILQQAIDQEKITIIKKATPKDSIPNNIKTLMEIMEHNGVKSLGSNVILGYKIDL